MTAPYSGVPSSPRVGSNAVLGGRYQLLARIGYGATGLVYRARDAAYGFPREVCIKRLGGPLAPEHARALAEEARLLASVRHANVVSLLAMDQDGEGSPFLVLELIEGLNLSELCHALRSHGDWVGFLPDTIAVHVACAVLRAIGAVQRALVGLVHRDVTPQNVLVSNEGEIKLADFGIALARDRARWTRPTFVKGKFGYMAPEQIRGEPLDVRSDLFAVGVVLYELLAARRPWGSRRGMEELRAIERGDIVPLALHRPRLSRSLIEACEKLLATRAEDRFASPDDALRALGPHGAGELASLRLSSLVREAQALAREDET